MLWKGITTVARNDILVGIPYMVLLYPLQQYMGCTCRPEDLPSILRVIRDVIGYMILTEIVFYYTHRSDTCTYDLSNKNAYFIYK